MISIISPAKSLDEKKDRLIPKELISKPRFFSDTLTLVEEMKEKSMVDLMELMDISQALAELNVKRFHDFRKRQSVNNSFRAAPFFNGGVYQGLKFHEWSTESMEYAQNHLRILSGLFGLLRPLDLIQPYRLEMGTSLKTGRGNDLYQFWGDKITQQLKSDFRGHKQKVLVNLASNEYFKVLNTSLLKYPVLKIDFREQKGDKLQFVSYTAKVARGLLARYIMENKIEEVDSIKDFSEEGYYYSEEHSSDLNFMFIRDKA